MIRTEQALAARKTREALRDKARKIARGEEERGRIPVEWRVDDLLHMVAVERARIRYKVAAHAALDAEPLNARLLANGAVSRLRELEELEERFLAHGGFPFSVATSYGGTFVEADWGQPLRDIPAGA